ncbi:bifunctional ornithine acetyltransferase/N-acetylglutamate synthase [Mycobacterium sp. E3247]|nr:bifunctional ornithine acetyltransferase/N-acetylglutamate synthase [Mycobacterium sp. E3247]
MISPAGFVSATSNLGIKDGSADFAVVVSKTPTRSASVFTQSRFAGPSVLLSRAIPSPGRARGFVAISKNANVATGEAGWDDAVEVRRRTAELAGITPDELVIASTGVIGVRYPMDKVRDGLSAIKTPLATADFLSAATAIMTTDTRPKLYSARAGKSVITGIAKGVGMMEPNMATLLAFFFTDADVPADSLDAVFRRVVAKTFNALSIDTDTSTSDTASIFSNGLAGPVDPHEFEAALNETALKLVRAIASDGEGASKVIEVHVSGAADESQARAVAKSVVNSPLVKTAVHGADPNWGRVAMAIGKLDTDTRIRPDLVQIRFGDTLLYPHTDSPNALHEAQQHLQLGAVDIHVDLGIGDSSFTAFGCDLSAEYVKINAEYTT